MGGPIKPSGERPGEARTVPLPVLNSTGVEAAQRGPRGWSSVARWRAAVLIGVQVLMAAHVLHWYFTGKSVGRFVLSDSMKTLELGEVNPGFLMFAGSLLVTALFGRLMCGWVCHMGALQDLAAWLLRRVGVRPRPFRSRLLGYVPLLLAGYMFVWPTLKREVLYEATSGVWPGAAGLLRTPGFPGVSYDLTTDRLWEGLPSWWVGVPFLLICGFGTVYFLGARGLCRYGCPYGGFLLPAEQLAIGRVVVDMTRCDQCGLCTAACTAGVRVHEDVRVYGAVVDRHCVRSLDCVSACPSGALRFGLAAPAIGRRASEPRPVRRADLSLGEELLCIAAFAVAFLSLRGVYGAVPMLLAASLGVLTAFVTWKALRLVRDANVRLGGLQLRLKGRLRGAGWAFGAGVVLVWTVVLHSGLVTALLWRAHACDEQVTVGLEAVLGGNPVPEPDAAAARAAERLYGWVRPWGRGGLGLAVTPEAEVRLAWMKLVRGDLAGGEEVLRLAAASDPFAAAQLARLLLAEGRPEEAVRFLELSAERFPEAAAVRDLLAVLWARGGKPAEAEALYRSVLKGRPSDCEALMGLGRVLALAGRGPEGLEAMRLASSAWPRNAGARHEFAMALGSVGRVDEALAELRDAARCRPAARGFLDEAAALLRRQQGR